jgi:hypothetical protein
MTQIQEKEQSQVKKVEQQKNKSHEYS